MKGTFIMEQKIYRAACYCRLSDDDANDGMSVSIDTKMTIHKQYCQQNKIQIVDFYCDDGFTGTNFERQPCSGGRSGGA